MQVPKCSPVDEVLRNAPKNGRSLEQYAAIAQQKWHDLDHTNVKFWVDTFRRFIPAATYYTGKNKYGQDEYLEYKAGERTVTEIRSNLVNALPPRLTKEIL